MVNVIAAMRSGAKPTSISRAILCVITRVLPDPAPANTKQGPDKCITACCCAGFKPTVNVEEVGGAKEEKDEDDEDDTNKHTPKNKTPDCRASGGRGFCVCLGLAQ